MKHVERTVSRRNLVAGLTFAAGTCLMGGASPAWAARSVFGGCAWDAGRPGQRAGLDACRVWRR